MSDNIPEHMVDGFNKLLSDGDVFELEEVINKMKTYYHDKTQGEVASESNKRQPQQQEQPSPQDYGRTLSSSPEYQELVSIASEVLSTDEIQKYDALINSGDVGMMSRAVSWLSKRINE